MNRQTLPMLATAMLLGFVGSIPNGHAEFTATFDFENIEVIDTPRNFTAPIEIASNGLTVSFGHENNVPIAINRFTSRPLYNARFGQQSITMFNGIDGALDSGAIVANFSLPITSVTMDVGDFGLDQDDVVLQAFSGPDATGAMIAQQTGTVPGTNNSDFIFTTVSLQGQGIESLRMIAGSAQFPNSVHFDNITVTAVPEPASIGLLATFAGLPILRRARRRHK